MSNCPENKKAIKKRYLMSMKIIEKIEPIISDHH